MQDPDRPDAAATLLRALGAAVDGPAPDDALDAVVAAVAAAGWDLVVPWTLDDAHHHLRRRGRPAGDVDRLAALVAAVDGSERIAGQGLVGRAWATLSPVAGDRDGVDGLPRDDPASARLAAELGLDEVVAVPLHDGPLLAAVLEVRGADPGGPDARRARRDLLEAAAALVGPALVSLSARAAAAVADARFRAVVDTAADAIVLADRSGAVVGWNPAAEAVFGYREDEIRGRQLTTLMPERFQAAHREGLARVAAGGDARMLGRVVEVVGRRRDGTEFPVELALSSWPGPDGASFAGILRDVSARHAAESATRAAREEAERASAAKTEFLSRMSHELRTPLNAILGFAQLLALEPGAPDPVDPTAPVDPAVAERVEAVDQVLRAGGHLLALVDDVLDLGTREDADAWWSALLATPPTPGPGAAAEAPPAPDVAPPAPPRARVLYVEDNPANVRLVDRILARTGDVELVAVLEGLQALDAALARPPDLVLLDLHLPDCTGEDVLAALRAHEATAGIPVVVVSADAHPERMDRLRELGAVGYITKPFDVATFVGAVRAHLPAR